MHIVGEVLNQAPVTAKFVKIIATFYNANGQVIGTDFAYANPSDLAPNQRVLLILLYQKEACHVPNEYLWING